MEGVVRAAESLFDHLASIGWGWVAAAVLCHVLRVGVRSVAWRNVVAAAFPDSRVRWRHVFGGYAAAAGVNAVVPARGGELLKLYIVRHRVEGATYPTLAATFAVEAIFDTAMGVALFCWALTQGVLPGLDVLPTLPSVDWFWLLEHPTAAGIAIAVLLVGSVAVAALAANRVETFRRRVAQGFAILRQPARYLRQVAALQALAWGLRILTIFFFLRAFGVNATFENALLAQVSQSLSSLVPVTPNGIGTEQALLVFVLRGEGSPAELLSFSVGMGFAIIAANVVLGSVATALVLRTLHLRRALERARAAAATER